MKFVVYRGSWMRGSNKSRLLKGDKQCCMGQVAVQCGVPLEELGKKAYLCSIDSIDLLMARRLVSPDGRDVLPVNQCYRVNDAIEATVNGVGTVHVEDNVRERILIELMAILGHELSFEDGFAPWLSMPNILVEDEEPVELVEEDLVPA